MQLEKQNHGIQITPVSFSSGSHGSPAAASIVIPLVQARLTSSTTMVVVTVPTPPACPCCQLPIKQMNVCLIVARRSLAPRDTFV